MVNFVVTKSVAKLSGPDRKPKTELKEEKIGKLLNRK